MRDFVADTHAVIWYLAKDKRLSRKARAAFLKSKAGYGHVVIPSIVLVESIFLVQRRRADEEVIKVMLDLSENPAAGIYIYPLNKTVVRALSHFGPATIPESPDRIIAATALHLSLPLLTADLAIQSSELVETVW
jgi:PIN domain nuclease of toxin-antitoxin system